MPKREERRTTPKKPTSWGDRIKVVSGMLGGAHYALKIWEWFQAHGLI